MSSERMASRSKGARALRALILGRVHTLARPEQPPSRAEPVRRCGARRSYGRGLCRCSALYANGRCRMHGGPSRGPVTAEGKARALAALAVVNARRKEQVHPTMTTPTQIETPPSTTRLRGVIRQLEQALRSVDMATIGARLDVLERIEVPLRELESAAQQLVDCFTAAGGS